MLPRTFERDFCHSRGYGQENTFTGFDVACRSIVLTARLVCGPTASMAPSAFATAIVLAVFRVGRHEFVDALVLVFITVHIPDKLRHQQIAVRRQTYDHFHHADGIWPVVLVQRQRLCGQKCRPHIKIVFSDIPLIVQRYLPNI